MLHFPDVKHSHILTIYFHCQKYNHYTKCYSHKHRMALMFIWIIWYTHKLNITVLCSSINMHNPHKEQSSLWLLPCKGDLKFSRIGSAVLSTAEGLAMCFSFLDCLWGTFACYVNIIISTSSFLFGQVRAHCLNLLTLWMAISSIGKKEHIHLPACCLG